MAGGAWRRGAARARILRALLRDTARALQDVQDILPFDPEVLSAVQDITNESARPTALVILGTSPSARARLLNCLVGKKLLPESLPRGCKWLRIQYGASTQVHLTVGNSEFELVEELECNRKPWDTLPLQDLLRQSHTDLGTTLEVELTNSLLKDGLRIIIPPDINSDPGPLNYTTLKQLHKDLYQRRSAILKTYTPIYLYALDKFGRTIFNDNVSKMSVSRGEEDFWSTFNLYYMTKGNGGGEEREGTPDALEEVWKEGRDSVFNVENFLDLHQIKELDSNAQVFFCLFANSRAEEKRRNPLSEATESTESALYSTEELPESDQGIYKDRSLLEPSDKTSLNSSVKLFDDLEFTFSGQVDQSAQQSKANRRLQEEQIAFMNELLDQWEFISKPPQKHHVKSQWSILDDVEIMKSSEKSEMETGKRKKELECGSERTQKTRSSLLNNVVKFAVECSQTYLLDQCTRLSEIHVKLLQQFILASFDMARELQVVPTKIQYVATQEQQLYETINEKFSEGDKKQELLQIMQEVLQEMRSEINNMDWSVDDLPCHQDKRYAISNSIFYSSRSSPSISLQLTSRDRIENEPDQSSRIDSPEPEEEPDCLSDVEEGVSYESYNFDDFEIIHSNDESLCMSDVFRRSKPDSPMSLNTPIPIENETELYSLSNAWRSASVTTQGSACTSSNVSSKQASLDVQRTVLSKLSRKISLKMVKFVDCLKDTYFGTLQRCLESLESSCRQELGGRPASEAMRQLLSVARQVDLTPCASFSLLRGMMDSLRRLFYRLRMVGSEEQSACCVLSPAWRRAAALHTAQELTPQRLARLISLQILERLSVAHERYQSALTALESALASRLHHTEDIKLAIRKKYAPSFAQLCLESTSMCDLLMYGTPELGREIGRGQYGVVYAVRGSWAGHSPACVKSVFPADDRHYRELAMEFFYTRSIPAHPRIVRLLGSLVQRGGGGAAPGVLLVSQRYSRDLHAAVRAGLAFPVRMRIACDIVEGIRYLHSLGLVHRDVKLKNVLLDEQARAALSDLGFCAAEALMSGSVVGTPVHMAPELLAGHYHAAVDVYAFGILFWVVKLENVLLDEQARAALSDLGFCAAEALMSGSVVGTPVHMAPELLAGHYHAAVDVYAFGILFWYLCAGYVKLPSAFETFQNKEQLWSKVKRGLRPERLPNFSDECWEVMESCWASEPSQRALLGDIQPKLEAILQKALKEDQGPVSYGNNLDNYNSDDSLDMTGLHRDARDDLF